MEIVTEACAPLKVVEPSSRSAHHVSVAPEATIPPRGRKPADDSRVNKKRAASGWLRAWRIWWAAARPDHRAAITSAIIMLPQAVALATLAGLPPEVGIYTSVFPVIAATAFGASPVLLSGPNTAIAVIIFGVLAPIAVPYSADYVRLACLLALAAGLIQVAAAAFGLARVLARFPSFVSDGLTTSVGAILVLSQIPTMTGLLGVQGEAAWTFLVYAIHGADRINVFAVATAAFSVALGVIAGRKQARYLTPMVAATIGGSAFAYLCGVLVGPDIAAIDYVGELRVALLPLSVPQIEVDEVYVLKQLFMGAVVIAVVGCLQTVIIAQSVMKRPLSDTIAQRELCAQGIANIVAGFFNGFAVSGSFNRSAAHVAAGARTKAAAMLASAILLGIAASAAHVFAFIAYPAVAGTLVLIGAALFRNGLVSLWRGPWWARTKALAIIGCAIGIGMMPAFYVAVILGLVALDEKQV